MLGWQSHHAWTQGFWGGGEDQTQALYLVGELSVVRLDSSSLCLLVFNFFFLKMAPSSTVLVLQACTTNQVSTCFTFCETSSHLRVWPGFELSPPASASGTGVTGMYDSSKVLKVNFHTQLVWSFSWQQRQEEHVCLGGL